MKTVQCSVSCTPRYTKSGEGVKKNFRERKLYPHLQNRGAALVCSMLPRRRGWVGPGWIRHTAGMGAKDKSRSVPLSLDHTSHMGSKPISLLLGVETTQTEHVRMGTLDNTIEHESQKEIWTQSCCTLKFYLAIQSIITLRLVKVNTVPVSSS